MQAVDMNIQPYAVRETECPEKPHDGKKTDAEPVRNGDSFLAMVKKLIAGSKDGSAESFDVQVGTQEIQEEAGEQDLSDFSKLEENGKSKTIDLRPVKKDAGKPKKADSFDLKEKTAAENGKNLKAAQAVQNVKDIKIGFAEEVEIKNLIPQEINAEEKIAFFQEDGVKDLEKPEKKKENKNSENLLGIGSNAFLTKAERKDAGKKSSEVSEKDIKPKKPAAKQGKPVINVEDLRLKTEMQSDASVHRAGLDSRVETDNFVDMTVDFRGRMQDASGGKDALQFTGEGQKTGQTFSSMLSQEIRNTAGEIRLQLRPENLGNVKIHLKLDEGKKVNGVVTVATKEAYEAFEENLDNLAKEFKENGFEAAEFSLSWSDSSSKESFGQGFELEDNFFVKNGTNDLRQAEKSADKLNMQVHNVSQAVDAITERAQMMENTSFEMSPAERARLELEVNTLNRQNFPENRVPKQELGKDDFLQLLIAQLTHQDPTSPMEDTQFIGQMAQFSSLEQMTNMNKNFSALSDMLTGSSATNAVGKKVDLDLGSSVLSGYISAATRGANPEVMVNGNWYSWSAVKTIYAE